MNNQEIIVWPVPDCAPLAGAYTIIAITIIAEEHGKISFVFLCSSAELSHT